MRENRKYRKLLRRLRTCCSLDGITHGTCRDKYADTGTDTDADCLTYAHADCLTYAHADCVTHSDACTANHVRRRSRNDSSFQ